MAALTADAPLSGDATVIALATRRPVAPPRLLQPCAYTGRRVASATRGLGRIESVDLGRGYIRVRYDAHPEVLIPELVRGAVRYLDPPNTFDPTTWPAPGGSPHPAGAA